MSETVQVGKVGSVTDFPTKCLCGGRLVMQEASEGKTAYFRIQRCEVKGDQMPFAGRGYYARIWICLKCLQIRFQLVNSPAEESPNEEAVQALLRCLWLYPSHTIQSRGPAGLILKAIEAISPTVARALSMGVDPGDLVKKDDEQ